MQEMPIGKEEEAAAVKSLTKRELNLLQVFPRSRSQKLRLEGQKWTHPA
jgi:hypothetical protein